MRFLLVFLVVLVLAWRWRTWRETMQQKTFHLKKDAEPDATAIIACHQCGVHVPIHDAVVGAKGSYCSAAHRLAVER